MDIITDVERRGKIRRSAISEIAAREAISQQEFDDCVGAVLAWAASLPKGLSLTSGLDTVARQEILTEKESKSIRPILARLEAETGIERAVKDRLIAESTARAAAPRFKGMWTRCVAVGVFQPEYDPGIEDLGTYEPEFSGVVPRLIAQIDTDEFGRIRRFSFSLSIEEVQEMIKRFQLAQKQMELMLDSLDPRLLKY